MAGLDCMGEQKGAEVATKFAGSGIVAGVVVAATEGSAAGVLGAGRQVAVAPRAGIGMSMAACNLAISSEHSAVAAP